MSIKLQGSNLKPFNFGETCFYPFSKQEKEQRKNIKFQKSNFHFAKRANETKFHELRGKTGKILVNIPLTFTSQSSKSFSPANYMS